MEATQKVWTVEQRAENRRKWIAALRSGDYPQCRGFLKDSDSYCCLGVGAKISGWDFQDDDRYGPEYGVGYSINKEAMGLSDDHGWPIRKDIPALFQMNDRGESFDNIADHFERHMIAYLADEDAEYERQLAAKAGA